ncbi:MAG: TrbC/VirB2 family protein [Candidatus Anaerobiospirillum pullicola]|uniref:TrbC/VirB2 family protein n=1 Tax=Candidatus Anaerobiospirillum pullicola TaxID=2838451 RepID=A0A948TIF0_9GAMM|nr:TrbC/VirB2 family protein [Candidatus Anaerobiospirillum pullicola]
MKEILPVTLWSSVTSNLALRLNEALRSLARSPWQWRSSLLLWFSALLCLSLLPEVAWASSAGGTSVLPYEQWLSILQKSLTGPVAFSVSLIGIVTCGATLILGGGEISHFMRTLIYIVLVMTLLVGANALMNNFFNGASIGSNTTDMTTEPPEQAPFDNAAAATQSAASSSVPSPSSRAVRPVALHPSVFAPPETSLALVTAAGDTAMLLASTTESAPYQRPTFDPNAAPAPAPHAPNQAMRPENADQLWHDLDQTRSALDRWSMVLGSIVDAHQEQGPSALSTASSEQSLSVPVLTAALDLPAVMQELRLQPVQTFSSYQVAPSSQLQVMPLPEVESTEPNSMLEEQELWQQLMNSVQGDFNEPSQQLLVS